MTSRSKSFALAALLLLVGACKRDKPTEPSLSDAAALAVAQADLAAIANALPTASHTDPATSPPPLLSRLTHIALERLTNAGADDAKARIVAELRARHEQLRLAVESGDREAILQAKRAFEQVSARVVVAVLSPRIVPEVIQHVSRQVRTLSERLDAAAAEGRDVAGPRRVLRHVVAILTESRAQFERGNHVAALLIATTAADRLHTAFHR